MKKADKEQVGALCTRSRGGGRRVPQQHAILTRTDFILFEMASPYDAEGEALAEKLMLAELLRLTPPRAAATAGLSLSAQQLELLGRLNTALREEYALRRAMLLKRLARRLPFASHAPLTKPLALPNRSQPSPRPA